MILLPARGHAESLPDSIGVHAEVGAGTDLSNEIFYEDAYSDTTFLGRRLVGDPETRWSVLGLVALEGTRSHGRTRYRLQQDASVGDRVQRGALTGLAAGNLGASGGWTVAPRVEFRHDQTFDRDLSEWQGELGARFLRAFDDAVTDAELGVRAEILRSAGIGSEFVPDRESGRLSLVFTHAPLFGTEWRFGYSLAARTFPDSTSRDHLEHGLEARVRVASKGGHVLTFESELARRKTVRPAPTSRDDLLEGQARLDGLLRLGDAWSLTSGGELESMHYDAQDSALYFDYTVTRARLAVKFERVGWSLAVGPRGEVLSSRLAPAERYQEIAGVLELELLNSGAWWSIAPAGGWRDYEEVPPAALPGLHSSYAYAEAVALADQALPGRLRFRATGLLRLERHVDRAQDARSLYFSLELRKLL